jgi:excisionase family DNA binding protein
MIIMNVVMSVHGSSGGRMSDTNSLPDRIAQFDHALTAAELSKLLAVSKITIFKHAATGRIPSFRVGSCVRFDPRAVAIWLRRM